MPGEAKSTTPGVETGGLALGNLFRVGVVPGTGTEGTPSTIMMATPRAEGHDVRSMPRSPWAILT